MIKEVIDRWLVINGFLPHYKGRYWKGSFEVVFHDDYLEFYDNLVSKSILRFCDPGLFVKMKKIISG